MNMMYNINLKCCVCNEKATNVLELDKGGFRYYCDEHINKRTDTSDMQAIKKIMNRR